MIKPVLHGDTIRLEQTVVDKKETSKPEKGIITLQRKCRNQRGEVVQEMEATLLYRRRP